MKRGLLIVLEGCDRVGKSTQVNLLLDYFQTINLPVQVQKFPDRTTELGTTIDKYLKGQQDVNLRSIHLLFSANRWELINSIHQKLSQGINVIVDRYAYSGVAYTSAKGIDLNWCRACDSGLLTPDLVVYLDINPSISASREGFGEEVYENIEFQKLVYQQFEKLRDESWKVVDANQTKEKVFLDIKQSLEPKLKQVGEGGLEDLKFNLWL